MKKRAFFALTASLLLVACGGSGETPVSSSATPSSSSSLPESSEKSSSSSFSESSSIARYLITFKDEEGMTLDSREWE